MDSRSITTAMITASAVEETPIYKVELYQIKSDGKLEPVHGAVSVGDSIVSQF